MLIAFNGMAARVWRRRGLAQAWQFYSTASIRGFLILAGLAFLVAFSARG